MESRTHKLKFLLIIKIIRFNLAILKRYDTRLNALISLTSCFNFHDGSTLSVCQILF